MKDGNEQNVDGANQEPEANRGSEPGGGSGEASQRQQETGG